MTMNNYEWPYINKVNVLYFFLVVFLVGSSEKALVYFWLDF